MEAVQAGGAVIHALLAIYLCTAGPLVAGWFLLRKEPGRYRGLSTAKLIAQAGPPPAPAPLRVAHQMDTASHEMLKRADPDRVVAALELGMSLADALSMAKQQAPTRRASAEPS